MRAVAAALLLTIPVYAGGLSGRIEAALQSSPEAQEAFWGIQVVDLATGEQVYAKNEDKFFIPASVTKLFSTALALMRLGPDHRFITTVMADARPDPQGRVTGLRLVGGGDPNLSARVLPYERNALGPNALAAIDSFADALVAAGVRSVEGNVSGDDTAYVWEPFPDGWSIDDPIWEYGAPVSALTLNDNAFTLTARPGQAAGDPAQLTLFPPFEYMVIHNRTSTVSSGETKLAYDRLPNSAELVVRGTIRLTSPAVKEVLAIDDPALFAAQALKEALQRRNVQVKGSAVAVHRSEGEQMADQPSVELARHSSLPIIESLRVINKASQNLHAELMLREAARAGNGVGTRKGGIEELKNFLTEIGVDEKQYHFDDGSGLSRLTLVTPRAVAKLLTCLYNTPYQEAWVSTLAVGGADGTLFLRFGRDPEAVNIRAKTGSVSHVSALAGYALRKDGGRYAFSMMVNNFNSSSAPIRKILDSIALSLLH